MSECWKFYALPTARVIFLAKTSFDVSSLSREQVWTFLVLGDQIYEMRCLFVAVGLNTLFIVLPHWDNWVIGPHANPLNHIILTLGRPVMLRGPDFIISTMQAGTDSIFKVFGLDLGTVRWDTTREGGGK